MQDTSELLKHLYTVPRNCTIQKPDEQLVKSKSHKTCTRKHIATSIRRQKYTEIMYT